ncbi:MAG TPA: transglutaminase domain-containing protein [Candidatus Aminicenantes bacterium]|nr:transglutaminase domain-containing protein [Candidatus Aminicenantes bacterium]
MKKSCLTILISLLFSITLPAGPGAVTRRIPLPSGFTTGLAFDGEAFWTVDRDADKLFRIDAAGGRVLAQFDAPGYFCTALAWDGQALWVADMDFTNTSAEDYCGKIYRVDTASGRILKVIMAPASDPQGLAWDGASLWVADNGTKEIFQISPDDGTTIRTLKAPAADPRGLAWDGSCLWLADRSRDELYRMEPEKGRVVMILPAPGPYPWGLAWTQDGLWVADYQEDQAARVAVFAEGAYTRSQERRALVTFTHDVINFGPGTVTGLDVCLALPKERSTQEILGIDFARPPDGKLTDRWGQEAARFHYSSLKPGERATTRMRAKVKVYDVTYHLFPEKAGSLKEIPAEVRGRFLADDDKYRLKDPVIRAAVQEAVQRPDNPYWIARDIYDWLHERMVYKRIGGWDIAPTVLQRGSGSCSEYAFVYISMCRAAGLPARYVGSVVTRGEEASFDFVYHRWVEVYLPRSGWVPVDPSGGDQDSPRDQAMYFGHLDNRFLITTESGGGSEYLKWDYNSSESWQADGRVQLRLEMIADWDKLE